MAVLTTFDPMRPVPPITTIFILLLICVCLELFSLSDSGFGLTFEEREQVGVDDVGLRRDHAVRQIFVCLQRAVLEELG
jgi:hypothetical protein